MFFLLVSLGFDCGIHIDRCSTNGFCQSPFGLMVEFTLIGALQMFSLSESLGFYAGIHIDRSIIYKIMMVVSR